ncbi:Zn-ribbon domain-containing OB-fold protein [Tsukamurella sp. 1534]|uniref:Zn-ribbon domain-containing OB-fold protein n=1 Tax=Tsukamurella sp. 1534 TaxID=1151061 RepID=UPI00030DE747|nr:OB-fold nucleic acid binding domain-containing protein [Tsukamurella sp. 1534]
MTAEPQTLSAPLTLSFDYTRSLGPVLGAFMTNLRARRIVGTRDASGRVHVPPLEFDPDTTAPLTDVVAVSDTGTVTSWTWNAHPVEGQPFDRPFAYALVRLDGADTSLLHAVDVASPDRISTGMRVRARWAEEPTGAIGDILAFEPGEGDGIPPGEAPSGDAVTMVTTPVNLHLHHSASEPETRYLRAMAEGRLLGQRCSTCGNVYVPPRNSCPIDGIPTTEEVDLPDTGVVTTFCVVNVPFQGQRIKPPYVAAYVLIDGADIPFLHLVLGCDAAEVRMGMRVRAMWRPREEWTESPGNISHFEPTGEPDAPYESYERHL